MPKRRSRSLTLRLNFMLSGHEKAPPQEERHVEFIVRPFRRIIERGPRQPAADVTGTIESGAFVFSVDGARFIIPAVRCGEDEHGQFAIIEESEQVLDHGFRLAVQVDPPDHGDFRVGCTICLFKPHPDLGAMGEANPEVVVLLPVDATLSIYFGPGGSVCGSGIMFRTPYPPGAEPPETKH